LLQEIKKQKGSDENEGSHRWWLGQLQDISKMSSGAQLIHLQRLERNPRTEKGWLSIELRVYRLHHLISEWVARTTDQETDAVRDEYTVSIIRIVKDLCELKELTATALEKVTVVFAALGFEDYFPTVKPSVENHELSFDFIKLIRSKSKKPIYKFMRISEHPIIWQLRLFGQYMDRSMGSKPDPRVSFEPDAWQRNVLDCLDRNESVLVVGKLR
jgi:ATP-dependent RNA helicase DDX60